MIYPKVAIIGRPNVGKSTLFNRLIGQKEAITSPIPGTTVDRKEAQVSWGGRDFVLIDTAGIGKNDLPIEKQIDQAIKEADVVLLVVTKDSPQFDVRKKLKNKQGVVAINKIDSFDEDFDYGSTIPISAAHGKNINTLLDAIVSKLPIFTSDVEKEIENYRIAIVGRPNVGKSTLLNKLVGFERSVVSDQPGTTRDRVEAKWKEAILVDTAGIRRPTKIAKGIEQQAVARALRSIAEANIVLIVVDASEGLTQQDLKIARAAINQHKKVILVFNKSDLGPPNYGRFNFLQKLPAVAISAKQNINIDTLVKLVESLSQNH